jgi:signal transduction histidine kinase
MGPIPKVPRTGHKGDLRAGRSNARPIALTITAQEVYLGIDSAIPCGLIINELVSNALKHAFPPGEVGSPEWDKPLGQESEIHIELHHEHDRQLTLIVADNGIGLPETVDVRNATSLGLQLVNSLVNQLDGTLELDRGHPSPRPVPIPETGTGSGRRRSRGGLPGSRGTRFKITFATARAHRSPLGKSD